MMYQKKSNRWLMLKAVAILPVTCFAIYAFATPESKVVEKLKNQVAAVEQSIKNVEAPVVELTMEEPAATIEQATETDKETAIAETPDTTATETSETVATEVPETTTAPKDSIYNVPEKLATFLEGEAAMYKHISQTMKYPKIAQECGVQGRVTVQFVVETDGTVSDITIINNRAGGSEVRDIEGEDPSITVICYTKKEGETQYLTRAEYNTARKALEDEVIRIVESTSGKWQPAEDKGQKVRCLFRLPISFRLH